MRFAAVGRHFGLCTVSVSALVLSFPAWGQEGPATAPPIQSSGPVASDGEAAAEAIVVTGSRIARTGFAAPTPVTVLGAEEIERRGAVNVGQVLNDIPAFRPTSTNVTGNFSSGGAGSNYADLRGLGTTRTLVLVDGHRFVPSALTGQVNLNLIPTLLIDRVETVTGGASAAYGSDAVAGVVNILLKKKLEGLQVTGQAGISNAGDDQELRLGAAAGTSFADDRGHITAGIDWVKNDGVGDIYNRDWGRREWSIIANPTPGAGGLPARIITSDAHFSTMARGGIITSGPLAGTAFGAGGASYQWNYGQRFGNSQIGGDGFGVTNYTYQPISPPVERYNALIRADFKILDGLKLIAEVSHGRSHSETVNGPPRDQANLTVQPDNAFIPADIRARRVALGVAGTSFTMGRYEDDVHLFRPVSTAKTTRLLAGLEGQLGGSWNWSAYYQYGRSDFALDVYNNRINPNWTRAIDAVVNPANGQVVCRANIDAITTNDDPNCVPLNIFGIGSPSAAARAYVSGTAEYDLKYTQHVAALNVSGDLFSTWAGPVGVAVGAEYRKDSASATSDAVSQSNGFQIGNPKPFQGSLNVKEVYAEIAVPLARDVPFLQSLEVNGAVRRTDYSTSGSVTTWKAGVTWSPVEDLRLRATRSRDIRAPNLSELFSPTTTGQTPILNPYTRLTSNVVSLTGGNPNLTPEIADTWTAGAVYQPSWAPGLGFSVDYYSIKLKNAVSNIAGQALVTGCFDGVKEYCSLVTYDANRNLTLVQVLSLNVAELKTSGLDAELSYRLPLSNLSNALPGTINFRLFGTYVFDLTTVNAGVAVDRAGAFGNMQAPAGVPDLTLNGLISYEVGPVLLSAQVRYLSGGKYDATLLGPQDAGYAPTLNNSISDNRVPAAAYVNTTIQFDVGKSGGPDFQVFGTINNLFDKDPPRSPALNGTNPVNTVYYDVIGRTFRVGVRAKF